jgi:hypothetical protein
MGFTRGRLEGMSDRELECILATSFNQHDKLREFEVKGELFYSRAGDEGHNIKGLPVPRYVTTREGFGQALEDIEVCTFHVELYQSADRSVLPGVVVSQRWQEEKHRAEASHRDLKRALALAAILVMYEPWYAADWS